MREIERQRELIIVIVIVDSNISNNSIIIKKMIDHSSENNIHINRTRSYSLYASVSLLILIFIEYIITNRNKFNKIWF